MSLHPQWLLNKLRYFRVDLLLVGKVLEVDEPRRLGRVTVGEGSHGKLLGVSEAELEGLMVRMVSISRRGVNLKFIVHAMMNRFVIILVGLRLSPNEKYLTRYPQLDQDVQVESND
jgi:hypothetical protein